MARQSSGNGVWIVGGVIVALASIPGEVWLVVGAAVLVIIAVTVFRSWKSSEDTRTEQSRRSERTVAEIVAESKSKSARGSTGVRALEKLAASAPRPSQSKDPPLRHAAAPAPVAPSPSPTFFTPAPSASAALLPTSHALPKAPPGYGRARWVGPDESIEIGGVKLTGGLFYCGSDLKAPSGGTDPCLIDPRLSIARDGDFILSQTDYWPGYSSISATARRAYLNWIASGRSHPSCDIGFVFLFFYGLERRVIQGRHDDPKACEDWPAIASEVGRLLRIYGDSSRSFGTYAGNLLDWMTIEADPCKLYAAPVPDLRQTHELPRYLRLALGQAAVDRAPVPGALALAWVQHNRSIGLRTAAKRCPDEFGQLFVDRYHQSHGPGMVLPKNRTKLKFVYHPASSGLRGAPTLVRTFGDIPDVSVLTAPLRPLQELADRCTDELAAFARAVGKDPGARGSLDGLLQLPSSLWPGVARERLRDLSSRVRDGWLTLTLSDLVSALGGASGPLTRDKIRGLARALEAERIGMEPDVLAGAKSPQPTSRIVLFAMPIGELQTLVSGAHQAACLTLQLASAVARADGEFGKTEIDHLQREISGWSHLTPAHQRRLHAHLQWLVVEPITLASLKKRLEPLELKVRETIATFMATLAQADGVVSPAEMKFLDKVYKALGVDSKRLFSDVHMVGMGGTPRASAARAGFRLDADRIAELQRDTAKVTVLLAGIFREEETAQVTPEPEASDEAPIDTGLLGLDTPHTALARLMLSRPQWTRAELEDAAADLDLMLDGALERINEASFDAHEVPFSEGDDPVDINADAVGKIEV